MGKNPDHVMDPSKHFEFVARFSYDAFLKRERIIGKVFTAENKTEILDTILLYRKRSMYSIFYHNKTCIKSPLTIPFRRAEIPHDATFIAQFVIGSSSLPGEGLLANSWTGEDKTQGGRYIMTATEFGCIPVSLLYNSNATGWSVTSYFDIINGIKDPEVFIPPEFCN
ncbi:ependymin-like isoform X2 [Protopterus annectens]|uniref:ependymin-like isoform X2 n=1 Tax=Protopterus annectens TaxID=7888 RepID=UPI001CFB39E7|nr:ependymin-like isoform X2 [Protopterus annectens]